MLSLAFHLHCLFLAYLVLPSFITNLKYHNYSELPFIIRRNMDYNLQTYKLTGKLFMFGFFPIDTIKYRKALASNLFLYSLVSPALNSYKMSSKSSDTSWLASSNTLVNVSSSNSSIESAARYPASSIFSSDLKFIES